MNQAVRIQLSSPPPLASPEFRNKLARISSRVAISASGPRLLDCKVGPRTRSEFEARRDLLDESLGHRDPEQLKTAAFQLMGLTKPSRVDGENSGDLVELYCLHFGRLPLPTWGLVQAMADFAEGRVGSVTFMPSAPEVIRRAEFHVAPIIAERAKISFVLAAIDRSTAAPSAKEPSAEERQSRRLKAAKVATEIAASVQWQRDLRKSFSKNFTAYHAIELRITDELADAATAAELVEPGAGVALILNRTGTGVDRKSE